MVLKFASPVPAEGRTSLLVLGHGGFVGRALQGWLPGSPWASQWQLFTPPDTFDIRDSAALTALLAQTRPHAVLHLAAQSAVPAAFADPAGTLDVNLGGTLSLLQALQASAFTGRLLYVSSADIYGLVPDAALPVTEAWLPAPRNPYAVSKLAAEALCRQWHFAHGLDVVVARPFNHTGPGQDGRFVLPSLARQVARIAAGRQTPQLVAGDLDVTRDFLDVEDVLAAYLGLLTHGVAGEVYQVCSGQERCLRDIAHTLLALAGIEAELVRDTARLRPAEQRRMVGSSAHLQAATGWAPIIPWQDTLSRLLARWRTEETFA